jgi:hypothetical protein
MAAQVEILDADIRVVRSWQAPLGLFSLSNASAVPRSPFAMSQIFNTAGHLTRYSCFTQQTPSVRQAVRVGETSVYDIHRDSRK